MGAENDHAAGSGMLADRRHRPLPNGCPLLATGTQHVFARSIGDPQVRPPALDLGGEQPAPLAVADLAEPWVALDRNTDGLGQGLDRVDGAASVRGDDPIDGTRL